MSYPARAEGLVNMIKTIPGHLTIGTVYLFITFKRFLPKRLVSRTFLLLQSYSYNFFNFCLFDAVHFHCILSSSNFLFLVRLFYSNNIFFFFFHFLLWVCHILSAKFHSYILAVYSYRLYRGFIFSKYLVNYHYHFSIIWFAINPLRVHVTSTLVKPKLNLWVSWIWH